MRSPSTRTLSALAFDRGEDYDPAQPLPTALLDDLELVAHAAPIVGDAGPVERRRQRARARRRAIANVPGWFAVDDLISAPWEQRTVHGELV
jgi:hypothetical protein